MDAGPAGRIILVNGTSSSGKTSLVKALQASLPDLWLEVGIDRFAYALPGRVQGEPVWPQLFRYVDTDSGAAFRIETTPLGERFISGMHATAAVLAERGLNVIVDHVLLERAWLTECERLWSNSLVLFVGLRCPLEVIVKRELERTDRTLGQAEAQFRVVHRWANYDVEVDTSTMTVDQAAARVRATLAKTSRTRLNSRPSIVRGVPRQSS